MSWKISENVPHSRIEADDVLVTAASELDNADDSAHARKIVSAVLPILDLVGDASRDPGVKVELSGTPGESVSIKLTHDPAPPVEEPAAEPEPVAAPEGVVIENPLPPTADPEFTSETLGTPGEVATAEEANRVAADAPGSFDPSEHTVEEVKAHVNDGNLGVDEELRIRNAEVAGENRSTLVTWLDARVDRDEEAEAEAKGLVLTDEEQSA